MTANTSQKLAVLIDADNTQASVRQELLAENGGKNEPATL